jgi:cell division protease FtsH
VRELVETAYRRAEAILQRHRAVLDKGARDLLAKETLDEDEVHALFAAIAPRPEAAPAAPAAPALAAPAKPRAAE